MIRRTIVALLSVLALTLMTAAPAQAAAQDTRVTANAKPEPVAKDRTITVTGTLKYKDGHRWVPTPRTKVLTIVFDPSGTDRPRRVATLRTERDGGYSKKFTASRSGTWTVRFAGDRFYQRDSASDSVCVYSAGRWQCPVSPTNPDLDCGDIRRTVWVGTKDYHRLDADNDGWGCDSYS